MPKITSRQRHSQLRAAGQRAAADSHPLPGGRSCVLRIPGWPPTRNTSPASRLDLRGTGNLTKPAGNCTPPCGRRCGGTDGSRSVMQSAHISGLSLGAASGHVARSEVSATRQVAVVAQRVRQRTDAYIQTVIRRAGRSLARAQNSMHETIIQGILPWCLTAGLYAQEARPTFATIARIRAQPPSAACRCVHPTQPTQCSVTTSHPRLAAIRAPTQITFGRHDAITSTRFAEPLQRGIRGAELHVFEDCAHAPLYENVPAFNETTLAFLRKHSS